MIVFLAFFVLLDINIYIVPVGIIFLLYIFALGILISYPEVLLKESPPNLRKRGVLLAGVIILGLGFAFILYFLISLLMFLFFSLFTSPIAIKIVDTYFLLLPKIVVFFLTGAGVSSIFTDLMRVSIILKKLLLCISGVLLAIAFVFVEKTPFWSFLFVRFPVVESQVNLGEWTFWAILFYLIPGFVFAG